MYVTVSAARVVSCLLWAHPFLYVSLLPCPSFSSPPNPPFQTLACYGRAWAPRAFTTDALPAPPQTLRTFLVRTRISVQTPPRACARAFPCAPLRADALLVRTPPRARACFPARVFCVRACFFARVFLCARVLLCARFCCVRACFPARVLCCVRACFPARVFPACARAFPRASSVCVRLFYHTACGRAHAECAPRFFCILT